MRQGSRGGWCAVVCTVALMSSGCFHFGFSGGDDGDPEQCDDQLDNDGDGLVDCEDLDCVAAPACSLGACRTRACTPLITTCDPADGVVELCTPQGTQLCRVGACDPAQACLEGTCSPAVCEEGEQRCRPDGTLQRCLLGAWLDPVDCGDGLACDPAQGEGCMPVGCEPLERFCLAEDAVGECGPFGVGANVIEICGSGEICREGSCEPACSDAGECRWFAVDLDNTVTADPTQFGVDILNRTGETLGYSIQIFSAGAWTTVVSGTGAPDEATTVPLPPRHVEGTGLEIAGAYRIVADLPAIVGARNGLAPGSDSGSLATLWPVSRLGLAYFVVSMPHDPGAESHPSGVVIVGTAAGTTVTVTPTAATMAGAGVPALAPGEVLATVIGEGDVLQLETGVAGADLSGTEVVASMPVAVYGFNTCATLAGPCDHVAEMMPPVSRLGMEHVVPLESSASEIRVVAVADGTFVNFFPSLGVSTFPAPQSLDSADVLAASVVASSDADTIHVLSDAPVLVAVVDGPVPAMTVVRPTSAWVEATRLLSTEGLSPTLHVVRLGAIGAMLDGFVLPNWLEGPNGVAGAFVLLSADVHTLEGLGGTIWGRVTDIVGAPAVGYDAFGPW